MLTLRPFDFNLYYTLNKFKKQLFLLSFRADEN